MRKIIIILFLLLSTSIFINCNKNKNNLNQRTKIDRINISRGASKQVKNIELYKRYKNKKKIKLPQPQLKGLYLEEAIKKRRSIREYSKKPLSLEKLSQLLYSAQGITGNIGNFYLRAAPSAGATYPIEVYLLVNNVKGLDKGIYHYSVIDHSIELLKEGNLSYQLQDAALGQRMVSTSAVTFILSAVFDRTTYRYGERGMRYIYMEAGHISQNIYLQATSLGLGSCCIGAFFDDEVNKLLGLDGKKESVIYLHTVGEL